MTHHQKPMTAKQSRELLAKSWKLTQEGMALAGTPIPDFIYFGIEGEAQIRATRVAELDELAKAVGAIDEDIERLAQGAAALNYTDHDLEQLHQEKASLIELQKRAGRSGCPGSITVIEALFPDIPVKKKTASEKAEDQRWRAIRKEAGLKIEPETAEVTCSYEQTLDPYGIKDEWELPEEFDSVGREYFARSPGSEIWVSFDDLPEGVSRRIWEKHRSRSDSLAGSEEVHDIPF